MLKTTFIAAGLAALAASPVALAQSTTAQVRASQHQTQATKGFHELQRAAQRLRESIQAMAQIAPGPQRDSAIRSAHEALFDANQAMLRLPVEYRGSAFTWSKSQGAQARAPAGQTPEQAMQQLRNASDRLYNAVHAMARGAAGGNRAQAIKDANEALVETHTAMAWVYDQQLAGSAAQQNPQAAVDARGTASSRAGGAVAGGAQADSASAIAGGVGINARVKLSDQALPEHNVKMVFALTTGNYVADVGVTVRDKSGRTLIDGIAHGPWLYARLPAGSYTASATYNGQTVTEQFSVGRSGQRTAIFRWPASAAHAASGVSPILGTGPQDQPPAAGR